MDIKKIAVTVLLAVLIPLFLALFIEAIYPEPKYEEFCSSEYYPKPLFTEENCSFEYEQEYQECLNDGGNPVLDHDDNGCLIYTECDSCSKEYQEKREVYNRNVFLIFALLGLIIVVSGIYLKTDYIGAGLMFGGLITLFYSSIRYFSSLDKLLRAIVILVDLLVIVFIAYKKIDKK